MRKDCDKIPPFDKRTCPRDIQYNPSEDGRIALVLRRGKQAKRQPVRLTR